MLPSPQIDLRQTEHQSMETARHHICIYHVILIGLGQELNLHLPLQWNSEFPTREKLSSSAIICITMVDSFMSDTSEEKRHDFG